MIRHQQSGHDLTFHDVTFHNLGDIGFVADPVPDAFRVNNHTWPHRTMIEAPGLICAHQPFQIKPFGLALEMSVELFRSQVCAATARVVFRALVDADENVTLERGHMAIELGGHGRGVESF